MSESENSELELHEPAAFGQQLMLAREKAGMSIEEAARSLNLKEEMVVAIEGSELDKLPPVAFVRGYIRTYAKLVGLPEDRIVEEFEAEVPELESELHPRSMLPDETDSQTPVIKLISAVIIVSAVVVLIYAVYSYYIEKSERIEQASLTQQEQDSATPTFETPLPETDGVEPSVDDFSIGEIQAAAGDDGRETVPGESGIEEQGLDDQAPAESPRVPEDSVAAALLEPADPVAEADLAVGTDEPALTGAVDQNALTVPTVAPITGGDVLTVSAEQQSWAEIVDANDIRLFYGMIEPGQDLSLTGQAPFDIFLGNAPVVSLSLNASTIDMTKYIRSNNIAQFKVSVEEGRIRFH